MHALEDNHWWFRGRRAVIWALVDRVDLPTKVRLLDAGCGTGRALGTATGVDPSPGAVAFCHERGLDDVHRAGLESLPFSPDQFDLVLASDVLEHVPDDVGALSELRRVVSAGGILLMTVPAYQWMWTEHDVNCTTSVATRWNSSFPCAASGVGAGARHLLQLVGVAIGGGDASGKAYVLLTGANRPRPYPRGPEQHPRSTARARGRDDRSRGALAGRRVARHAL